MRARTRTQEIRQYPNVCLTFVNKREEYLSVTGTAEVSRDADAIRRIWDTNAEAWFDGPEDPQVRLLKVAPFDAQYWEAPGAVMSTVKMLTAAATGSRPEMGRQAKVQLDGGRGAGR